MQRISVRGVVRDGQIVLDKRLDLSDGTVVTVTTGPLALPVEETERRALLDLLNRPDLLDDPDWRAKLEPDRIAYTEKLILELAGARATGPDRCGRTDREDAA